MSYNNRYKIMDVKLNKQLKNDEIVLQRIVKVNPNPRPKRITTAMVMNKLIEFMERQEKHNVKVDSRLDVMDAKITDTVNLLNKVIKLNNLKTE